MAKKKSTATTSAKKNSKTSKSTKSTKSSKSIKSKKSSKSATRRRAAKSKSSMGSTVDGVLKTFEKERVVLNDKLGSARKKVEQLAKQIEKLKGQLDVTRREIVESDLAIATLDARRDREIGLLLSGLGVDLGKVAAAAKPKPTVDQSTPLFDEPAKKKAATGKQETPPSDKT